MAFGGFIKQNTMRDKISIQRIQLLHPKVRDEARLIIEAAEANSPENIAIRIVQGLRTFKEQDDLFKKRPKVTNAKAGQSFHNYGLAIDFALLHDKDNNGTFEELSWNTLEDFDKDKIPDWQGVVSEFEKLGWEWGGKWRTFKDLPHCQKVFGNTWRMLLTKYESKDFIPGTEYVNL